MVFPSRGCITCKTRRIKCDSIHPICGRCQKANRDCVWDQNEEAGLLFRSENAFAQGKPRRPWKPREREEAIGTEISYEIAPGTPISLSPERSEREDEASHFWLENYVFRDDEIPEFAREYNHFLTTYRDKSQPVSSLRLAISAFSHVIYGRAMQIDRAIEDANNLFAQSVAKMRMELNELSQDNIDELMLTTMLMASYKNVVYGEERHHLQEEDLSFSTPDVTGSQFWKDVHHPERAVDLLTIRQQRGWTPNLTLDRAVRRQLIRTCILRGKPVDRRLHDGAYFGEEGPVLGLDSIIVRVAALRVKSLLLFLPKSARFSDELHPSDIVLEARDLDTDLESWSRTVPEDWKFSVEHSPESDAALEGLIHVYPTHGHATIWNRCRAIHLIVNSIRRRALSVMAQCSSAAVMVNAEQEECLKKIASISRDLCRGISFFLTSPVDPAHDTEFSRMIKVGGKSIYTNYEVLPKLATLLAWPLILATSTDGVPEPQSLWLKRQLKCIASALGNTVLDTLTEGSQFKF